MLFSLSKLSKSDLAVVAFEDDTGHQVDCAVEKDQLPEILNVVRSKGITVEHMGAAQSTAASSG